MLAAAANKVLRKVGIEIRRTTPCSGYLEARSIISAARMRSMTVPAYLAACSPWPNYGSSFPQIVDELRKTRGLENCETVCEIGPGTGGYLDFIIREANPSRYEIYETDPVWAAYLEQTFQPVVRMPADGKSLKATEDSSCQLVAAFGVFVMLPPLATLDYITEAARVCTGQVIFDCFMEEEFGDLLPNWLNSENRYPSIIPRKMMLVCINTVDNIKAIVDDMADHRQKSNVVHPDYLTLLDIEFNVFGRNREHIIHLPNCARQCAEVRK
jgi:hypothetical protein